MAANSAVAAAAAISMANAAMTTNRKASISAATAVLRQVSSYNRRQVTATRIHKPSSSLLLNRSYSSSNHGDTNTKKPSNIVVTQIPLSFTSSIDATSAASHNLHYYLQEWKDTMYQNILWSLPKGKGFGNFVPKKEPKEENGGDETSTKEPKNDGDSSSSFRSSSSSSSSGDGGKKGSGEDPPPPNAPPPLFASFALLLLTYLLINYGPDSMTDDPDNPNQHNDHGTREITWSDFCIHLLERGQVEKIVVTNQRTTARVFCKPGAPGMPYNNNNMNNFSKRWARNSNNRRSRQHHAAGETGDEDHHDHHEENGLEFMEDTNDMIMDDANSDGSVSSLHSSSRNGNLTSGSSRQGTTNRPHQLVYRFAIPSVESFEKKMEEAQRSLGLTGKDEIPVQYAPDSTIATELLGLLPSFLVMGLMLLMLRGASGGLGGMGGGGPPGGGGGGGGGMGGIFQIGKSNAKKIKKDDINVTFKDVAGCQEAKKEIMEFVDFLMDPSRFTKLGAKIPKGALLTGPPGTGKTLLAKAVAGEANVPFYSISGSDFIEMFVGVGPSRVRDLFKEARANAPCIVFIDEIDAVGRQRGRGGVGGNDERENTLNQLLVEMDGFSPSTGVVVLAGTNRLDILDQALTRPGRFDRQITVDKPDLQGRKEIFQVHLRGITLEGDDIDDYAGRLAGLTPGFAGADIANICNEAAIVAARRKGDTVTIDDFEKATDRVVGGLESNKIMSKSERDIVAHHEAGHAIAGWFLEHADPLLKVTIIPRTSGALGYAQYLPKEVFLRTQDQIMDIVCMALAGRAAEEIFFGRVTTGASDDLRRVTALIYSTIQEYGMNNRLGQLAFPKDPNAMFDEKRYSERTAAVMDEEAKAVVDAAYQRTLDLLREHKEDVEKLANLLLEKETITHDDVVDLVGPRPFKGDPAYIEFISRKQQMHHEATKEGKEVEGKTNKDDEEETNTGGSGGSGLNPGIAT